MSRGRPERGSAVSRHTQLYAIPVLYICTKRRPPFPVFGVIPQGGRGGNRGGGGAPRPATASHTGSSDLTHTDTQCDTQSHRQPQGPQARHTPTQPPLPRHASTVEVCAEHTVSVCCGAERRQQSTSWGRPETADGASPGGSPAETTPPL